MCSVCKMVILSVSEHISVVFLCILHFGWRFWYLNFFVTVRELNMCHTDMCIAWFALLRVKLFCRVIVEMLQKLKQASEAADETLNEVPVCNDSNSIDDAGNANEPDDGGKIRNGHEVHINTVNSASRDDDGDNVDASTDIVAEGCLSSINGMSLTLGQHDSEADQDSELSHHSDVSKETPETNDQRACTEVDQNASAKSDSGRSSPCTASADDASADTTLGIRYETIFVVIRQH